MTKIDSLQAAKKVIAVLSDRKGFDWWWEDIYPANRKEILQEIAEVIRGESD